MDIFWTVVGGGGIYFGCRWVVVDGGGYILAGDGWWWVVAYSSLTHLRLNLLIAEEWQFDFYSHLNKDSQAATRGVL